MNAKTLCSAVAGAALTLGPGVSLATGPGELEAVELEVVGDGDGLVADTLSETLGRAHLVVTTRAQVPTVTPIVRVTVDLRQPATVEILVEDLRPGGARFQRSIARDPSTVVTSEELAFVVRTTVDTMLTELEHHAAQTEAAPAPAAPGVAPPPPREPPAEVPRPAPRPAPAPPADDARVDGELSAFAAVRSYAAGGGVTPGLGVAVAGGPAQRAARLRGWVGAGYGSGGRFDAAGVEARASVLALRAGGGASVLSRPGMTFDVYGGGGADVAFVRTSATVPARRLAPMRADADPIAWALAVGSVAVGRRTSLAVGAEADAAFTHRRYLVSDGAAEVVLLTPLRTRWVGMVGLSVELGEPRAHEEASL